MAQTLSGHGSAELVAGTTLEALRRDPRRAISEEGIVCLVCGRAFRHLTNTHLAHHALTSEAYKQAFGYNGGRSLMARSVRRRHAGNAIRRGLALMIRRRPIVAEPALGARGGARLRAREEWLSRRESGVWFRPLASRDGAGRFVTASAPAS
jgi:hypothetical protein